MVLKLHFDPLSQPARALMLFLRTTKIEHEENLLSIQAGEHKTPEYAKINPFQKIPSITHDGFNLTESVAILRYLARSFPVDEHWYPKDGKKQARVDEYLEWQHLGIRSPVSRLLLAMIAPQKLGYESRPTGKALEYLKETAEKALNEVENIWLEGDKKFVGGDEISIADLIAVGELEMTRLVGFIIDARAGRPKVAAYLDRVRDTVGASLYDDVHVTLIQTAEVLKARVQSGQ